MSRSAPARVLLVEDDPSLGQAMAEVLRAGGIEVELVSTALQAAGSLGRRPAFDVVVTDIELPGNGLEVLDRARRDDVPVVVITGLPDPGAEHRVLRGGAFRFLRKPVSIQDLRGAVRAALERPS